MSDEKNDFRDGWGVDHIQYPYGDAMICTRDLLCVGCGICELACAYQHHGVLNRELSRIKIQKRLTPISKAIQNVCAQCAEEERACEKACPQDPPAIYFDSEKRHITVDTERCLGHNCGRCAEACNGDAIHFYPTSHDYAIVCDLCETNGVRRPMCVNVCPRQALEYMPVRSYPYLKNAQHLWRIGADEKAELIHKRTYPLGWDDLGVTYEPFTEDKEED